MDPFSVAAYTADLLSLSTRISGKLYGTCANSKSPGAQRLLSRLLSLRTVLQNLEVAALKIDTPLAPPPLQQIYENCEQILEKFERARSDSHSAKRHRRAFKEDRQAQEWFLSPLETERIITELQRCESLLLRW
jgi:hypothetical protein